MTESGTCSPKNLQIRREHSKRVRFLRQLPLKVMVEKSRYRRSYNIDIRRDEGEGVSLASKKLKKRLNNRVKFNIQA